MKKNTRKLHTILDVNFPEKMPDGTKTVIWIAFDVVQSLEKTTCKSKQSGDYPIGTTETNRV
jgi:hypothetical protein